MSDTRPWLREPWWAEVGSGVAALMWSILAGVYATRLIDLSAMRVLLTLADEPVWQACGAVVGLIQLTAAMADLPWPRWWSSLLALWWWSSLFFLIGSVANTPSLALYAVMAGFNLVPLFRILILRVP